MENKNYRTSQWSKIPGNTTRPTLATTKKEKPKKRGIKLQQRKHGTSSTSSIFIKNLHYEAKKSDIMKACKEAYGTVKDVWIPEGDKKGYASVVFENVESAQKALANGRLNVLGRKAFLVENSRPVDLRGDAFRFLASVSKGYVRAVTPMIVLDAVSNAGNPRSEKERLILASSLAKVKARDELLNILRWREKKGSGSIQKYSYAATSVYNAALSTLTVSTLDDSNLVKEIVSLVGQGSEGANARTYATAIASIKRGLAATGSSIEENGDVDVMNGKKLLSEVATSFFNAAVQRGMANEFVYNELISCFAKTGDYNAAIDVLNQMFDSKRVNPNEVSLNSVITSCAVTGQMYDAKRIYDEEFPKAKIQPTIITTNSLLCAAYRWIKKRRSAARGSNDEMNLDSDDGKRVLKFVQDVLVDAADRGNKLDIISTNALVSTYGAAGDVSTALKLFYDAVHQGTATIVTVNAALSSLAVSGRATEAYTLLHNIQDKLKGKTDRTSWNTVISACGISGDFDLALKLLDEMPHSPDAHSFASALSAIGNNTDKNHIKNGENNIGKLSSSNVKELLLRSDKTKATTTFVLNAALAAFHRLGDIASIRSLFEDGFQQRGLSPNSVSYNTVIYALGREDPAVALEIFSGMNANNQDEQSYCAAIAAAAWGGKLNEALEILQSRPSRMKDSLAIYNEALRGCYINAEPERAIALLQTMHNYGPKPNIVSTTMVINACAKAGRQYKEGFSLAESMQRPDLIGFNSAIALAEKSGDVDRAISFLKKLVRAGPEISPDAFSFCSAIAACERCSSNEKMKDKSKNNTLSRWRTAIRLLKESIKAVGPNAGCYIATVQTLSAAGKLDRAFKLLKDECVANFDDQSRYVLYRTVQVGYANVGNASMASSLGRLMQEQNLKPLAPQAKARVGNSMRIFDNSIYTKKHGDTHMVVNDYDNGFNLITEKVFETTKELSQKMKHEFVTNALPIEFQVHASQDAQETSLLNHAEKKALIEILLEEGRERNNHNTFSIHDNKHANSIPVSIEINFKMCADCHDFFKGASDLLGRKLIVREPTMLHIFEGGQCSCKDSWRWEARHSVGDTLSNRFHLGRLPKL